ncbi:MAG: ABC transporter permease [Verrucomicrobia bacterium]|nr:ABC transporter permease [Verrucomicrobiota bacterium]
MNDLKFAFRQLLKNSGFTAVAVLTLALGIGGSTAVFSLINAVMLRPLPYPEPERLVLVWTEPSEKGSRKERSSYGNYVDWKAQCPAFEDLAVYDGFSGLLTRPEESEKVTAARTSDNFFSVLGVSPVLGRAFTAEDASLRSRVVVVSHRLWQRRFAGASNALGQTLEIDGQQAEVIGVMPEDFAFPGNDVELWSLLLPDQTVQRGISFWFVLGRLKRDQSLDQAQAALRSVAARLAQAYPANRGLSVRLVPLSEEIAGSNLRLAFWILFGAVISVLLIGCSNLLNLLLVRGVARRRELATRLALGASPIRMVRQLGVECLPIGLLGGLGGVALADAIIQVVRVFAANRIPRLGDVQVDAVVVGFALGLTALATLIFAVIPGLQTRRLDIHESLKEGARGTGASRQTALRNALVIAEVALAFLLLSGAGLLLRSFQSVRALDVGFNPERVLCANLRFPQSASRTNAVLFYQELTRRLETLPGVEAVGLIEDVFGGGNTGGRVTVEGATDAETTEVTQVRLDSITPSWFQSVGAPLLRGRLFEEPDRAGSPSVAIINEAMARRFWPGQDALGKRFKFGRADSNAPWLTVVGVVGDMRRERLERAPLPQVFRPVAQVPSLHMELLVRANSTPLALAGVVRQEIHALDKSVACGMTTLEQRIGASLFERKFQTSLLSAFSLVALLLAGIGTYAVVHFSVQQRVREIGVRMALGAQRLDVFSLVVGQGMKTVLIGVSFGIALALGMTRLMQRLLYEVKPTDPLTLAGVSLLLLGVALLACWLPARRAMHVDPIHALREQ